MSKDPDPQFAHRTRTNRKEEQLPVALLLQYPDLVNPDTETDANPEDTP